MTGLLLSFVIVKAQTSADTSKTEALIKEATVYFGYGAELTHASKIQVDAGTRMIVINNLSTTIDINTLQISMPEEVALLSQRYSVFYPSQPPYVKPKEVEKMDDSIEMVQKETARIQNLFAIERKIIDKTGLLIETTVNTAGKKPLPVMNY